MKEELIGFEVAKLAKEKGFNITNRNSYDENTGLMLPLEPYGHCYALEGTCPAPTQSFVQKWLREKYSIEILITRPYNFSGKSYWNYDAYENGICNLLNPDYNEYESYEKALEKGLLEALKLI